MKPIQLHLAITVDEIALNGFAEMLRLAVENGNKPVALALIEAVKEFSLHTMQEHPTQRFSLSGMDTAPISPARDENQRQLIDAEEVSRLLGISPRTVWRLKDRGKLPKPVSIGSLVRWRKAEINERIAAGCPPVVKGKWSTPK